MERHLYKVVFLLVSVLLISSCQEKCGDEGKGYVSFSTGIDASVDKVFTKAGAEPVFALDIYDSNDELVRNFADINEILETPLELYPGNYKAVARSAEQTAAFDAPAYSGEAAFKVLPGQNSDVNITCSLSNVKVTAAFGPAITEAFSEYVLTVSNGTGTLVLSNLDGTLSKEAYFAVTGELSWSLKLVNKDGEVYETLHDTYKDVKARQHYNLSFNLEEKEVFGGLALEIVLDNSYNEKSYDLVLDFDDVNRPSINGSYFELSLPNTVYEALESDGRFNFRSEAGLKSVRILHENAAIDAVGLARANEFIGLDPAAVEAFSRLGILAPVTTAGIKEMMLDLSAFLTKLPKGEYSMTFEATDVNDQVKTEHFNFTVKPSAPVEAVEIIPWARYATVKGLWYSEVKPEGITFQYKAVNEPQWTEIPLSGVRVDIPNKSYETEIYGLQAGADYEVRAVTAVEKISVSRKFRTDDREGVLTNMSFDDWSKSGKNIYPNKDNAADHTWDSANEGSNTLKEINPTRSEANTVAVKGPGKNAARLESVAVVGNFAAGSIFTGDFGAATLSPVGATLQWGVPFESRPYALKGYFNYSPKQISHASGAYSSMMGKTDEMVIQIFLTDWNAPFDINTGAGRFVDVKNDPSIIAFGMLTCGKNTNGYVEFTIPLEYRDVKRQPKYIVISAAASRYGDYFTGAVGSVLYLDEFSFVYDPTTLVVKKQ